VSRLALRWTIGRKLTAAFATVVLLFIVALTVGLVLQGQANRSWRELDHWQQGQDALVQATMGARIQQAAQAMYALTGDRRYFDEWHHGVAVADAGQEAAGKLHDATLKRIGATAQAADHQHDANVNGKLFPAVAAHDAKATLAAAKKVDRYVRGPIGASERSTKYLTGRRQASIHAAERASSRARTVTIISALLGILVAALVAAGITRSLSGRIRRLGVAARHLAEGDTEHQLTVGGADELGQTARHFDAMMRSLRDLSGAAERVADGDLTVEV
jgi:methyl-accepting chemotaxis protein